MRDRFDFEQQILSCWGVTTDMRDLSEAVLENNLTKDQIANVLLGIQQLYEFRFDKLFLTFEQLVRSGVISSAQAKDPYNEKDHE